MRANSKTSTKAEVPIQNTVSGTIVDSFGVPLPGANVVVQGTTRGTQTDFDGNFSIEADGDDVLVVSYLGYVTQNVPVNGRSTVNVTMAEDSQALDEVIVTGYTTETKRETTAAVSIVKAEELAAIPSGNVEQQLAGRVAGVTVVTNGQPGTASQIRVRGFGAFGGNEPLYVVDGVPINDISFLNPDDIETTTVLKDAAAASIYGARAANGVIVYTTKPGRRNQKTEININIQSGVTDPNVAGSPEMLNPQQMAEYTHIAYRNNAAATGTTPQYTHPQYGSNATPTFPDYLHADGQNGVSESDIDLAQIRANYEADPENVFLIRPNLRGTNWYKEITRLAPATRISVGFRGGNENGRFYAGLGMQSLDGVLLENEQDRFTARFNSEFDLTPWLVIGENFQATYNSVRGQTGGNGGLGIANDESEILSAYRMPTIIPVFDEFGSYASTRAAGFNNPRNPVRRLAQDRGNDDAFSVNLFGNLYAALTPIEGLTLRTSIGGQYNSFTNRDYNYRYLGDSEPQASFSFNEGMEYGFQWIWTNTINYDQLFGKHRVKVLAGIEAIEGASTPVTPARGRRIQGSGINPFSTDLDYVNLQTVTSPVVQSFIRKGVNFSSIFGKLDYNFDEKYYVTGVIRRDGSSVFGENNRYGTFPAVSGAWRVIAEPFMENQSIFQDLKIRGGWGQMGNSNNVNPANQYSLAALDIGNTIYPIDGQNSGANEGFATSRIGNPDAKWETSTTINVGFDATILNNHVDIILDWWKKDTEDLLFQVPLPAVTGAYAAAPSRNVGAMLNQGVDFQIIGRGNLTEDLYFTVTLNNSFLKNEVVRFAEGIEFLDGPGYRGIFPTRNQVGRPLSSYFGYQVTGYFNSQAEVDAAPTQDGAGVGRFRYADINGDGVITPDDRTYLGDPVPEYSGGAVINLRYKQLSLDTFWNWVSGVEIFNMSKWFRDFFGTFEGSAKGVAALNSWTPELGNNAAAPIWESASNLSTSGAANSWYVEDGDYIRLQRIALMYSFDDEVLNSLGLKRLEFGVSANNVWTITKYSGLDPVVGGDADTTFGIDVGNYPVTPSYLFNLNIGL
ncbi:putative outer membrane protein, probably involved in nutrient binding [Robiginitalea biformata HTCC2501]|uniref:Putative outer membrane protein, probably involved in nutrient binding n=1 Tax=Robiginitalea biformata (strain ATCC BAA-864 / DSM 15991 / KCTC 12146 / HTCC2501) TaxID=313596 RepID=A4CK78_ROBBH|nr:putative outer membrane protein, probably involved in nutrient binding [Robiginitalea biformata HTCC2501]